MQENGLIFHNKAHIDEDERKIILLGLKILFADVQFSRSLGYPVDPVAIKNLVDKLGGRSDLL